MKRVPTLSLVVVAMFAACGLAQTTKPKPKVEPPILQQTKEGKLAYVVDAQGNRVPDYSYAGYLASNEPIPTVPAKVRLDQPAADNTRAIQAAIEQVGDMPLGENGFRGAVLLPPGVFPVSGTIVMERSGVVLRGSGPGAQGTTLLATGLDRRPLIQVRGQADRAVETPVAIADAYVPVNATTLTLPADHGLKAGESVLIVRPSTREWIESIKMEDFGGGRHGPNWKPGSRDLTWDRVLTKVEGNVITLDAPITAALDATIGGATVARYTFPGRVQQVGVENLRLESTYDKANPKDENHSWFGINIENAQDIFVRQVNAHHFVTSAVAVWESAKRVTVEDCKYLAPVGEIGGWRRYAFFTTGQQVLMQRLFSEDAYHDFSVGALAAGPNAFVQCDSLRSLSDSGAIDSLAAGALFDRVRIDGNRIGFRNRGYEGYGVGWSAISSMLWCSTAAVIECHRIPGGQNYAFGVWGEFNGDGYWSGANDDINPDSLFYAQLGDRLGKNVKDRAQLEMADTDASSNPGAEVAQQLSALSVHPGHLISNFIDTANKRNPIPTTLEGVALAAPPKPAEVKKREERPLKLQNGWLTINDAVLVGKTAGVPWWNLSVRATEIPKTQAALTRFVPGRTGRGFTDDLAALADDMVRSGQVTIEQHPPLWYDRRRDDHQRIRRMDGGVVTPFYEWPYARSGQGTAWDGLSKWDLTKPNPWYFSRLQQFADLGLERGLMLTHQHYMQHSILEAGAHYADYPWRTANNINNPGFPEPPYYAGDKRIFMAEQFYDISNPVRAQLHRTYIRECLNQLADRPNVINLIGEEFTGPQHFVEFWLDTIAEWEKETGKHALTALSVTKDVQDTILADPVRSKTVDIIDFRYWWPTGEEKFFSPVGGKNLAPRQWSRSGPPKEAGEQFATVVRDYRLRFPEKAVLVSAGDAGGYELLIAGASRVNVPGIDPHLLAAIAKCKPIGGKSNDQYRLGDSGKNYVIYSKTNTPVTVALSDSNNPYDVQVIDPSGKQKFAAEKLKAAGPTQIPSPGFAPYVIWIQAEE